MTLDGAPMEVSVTGEPVADAPKSVFQRLQGVPAVKNVRQGLFGTAMDDGEEMDDAPVHPRGGGPTFAVSLSAAAGGSTGARPQGKLVQPFSVPNESGRGVSFNQRGNEHNNSGNSRPRSDSNAGRYSQHDDRNERPARQQQQQNGGSGGGSRGGDRRGRGEGRREGRGAGKPQQRQQQQATANPKDLDAELDAYFASK